MRTSVGGRITSATSAEPPVEDEEAEIAATSVSVLTTSVVSPCERTSESASTSEVSRAMIQPAFCCAEVAQRQRRQVVEEVLAQAEHEVLADAGEAADERRLQHPGERR